MFHIYGRCKFLIFLRIKSEFIATPRIYQQVLESHKKKKLMSSFIEVAPPYQKQYDEDRAKVKENKKLYDERVKQMYRVVGEYKSFMTELLEGRSRTKRPLTKKLPELKKYQRYFLDSIDFLNYDKANENFTSKTPNAQLKEKTGLVDVTDRMSVLLTEGTDVLPSLEALIENPQYADIGGIWDSISSAYAGAKKKASEAYENTKQAINEGFIM